MDNGNFKWVEVEGSSWPHVPDTISLQRRGNGAPPIDTFARPAPTVTVTGDGTGQWEVKDTRLIGNNSIAGGPLAERDVTDPALTVGYRKAGDGPRQNAPGSIKVTPEEAAVLQNFPHAWQFVGKRSSVFRQIGNACPPAFTEAIVRANTPTEDTSCS